MKDPKEKENAEEATPNPDTQEGNGATNEETSEESTEEGTEE